MTRAWIEPEHPDLTIQGQCRLLGLPRSSWYYQPLGRESDANLRIMRAIDELYLAHPYFGSPRMTEWLRLAGWLVNEKRVARLMRVMGLQAALPGPHTSRAHPERTAYPYLLRGLQIKAPNEVWCADITYVPVQGGYMFLVAVLDWFSRYVLAWELSNTLDSAFCVKALRRALGAHGPPEISNTDQGAQFTGEDYLGVLREAGVRISMDGQGRALDNVMIERFWWSIKHEDIYRRDYRDGFGLQQGVARYIRFYNTRRLHQSLGYRTPLAVYQGGVAA